MSNQILNSQTPPQNIEAEKAVLGAIFLNQDSIGDALAIVNADDFYKHAHRIIFEAMVHLYNKDEAIDAVTMGNYLTSQKTIEDVGGLQYIADLAGSVPTASNITYYAKIVREKSIARKLIKTASSIISKSYSQKEDVNRLLDEAERDILNVASNRNDSGFKPISDVLNNALNDVDKLSQNHSEVTGLSTGYPALDKLTTGLHDDELVILAARPAVGKTAFALNIAQNVGTKTDQNVAIFSLEMSAESLVNRMICAEGSIDANHLRTGQLSSEEWHNMIVAIGSLSNANIFIDDTAGISIADIRAKSRRLAKEKNGLGLVIVDYLQLIEGTDKENRQQEVSGISRQLKKLSKELHVPIVALSQLSRGVEQRQDKRPVLSDIRESGSIEQDADIVSFLYRKDYYEHDDNDDDDNQKSDDTSNDISEVEVIVEKNRSGPRGTVKLLFIKSHNKFSSISYSQQGPGIPSK